MNFCKLCPPEVEISPLSSDAQTSAQISIHHKGTLISVNADTHCEELELFLIEITNALWNAKIFVYL